MYLLHLKRKFSNSIYIKRRHIPGFISCFDCSYCYYYFGMQIFNFEIAATTSIIESDAYYNYYYYYDYYFCHYSINYGFPS